MTHDIPKLLKRMMELVPGKQAGLAQRLGKPIDQPLISKWLRKQQTPTLENYTRVVEVARELGVISDVRSEDVAASLDAAPMRHVKIKGYVGAGSEAHYYALSDEDFEEVSAPLGATDKTVAVEIKGKSWGPLLDSWIVFYDDVRSPITDDLLGNACIVGLADDRILIKQIKRERDGSFTLLSNADEPPVKNAQIEWAAKVIGMRPRK
jgi:hypothetical protein